MSISAENTAKLVNSNIIIAVGSVDGVLTTAAFLRLQRAHMVQPARVIWTQAFQVDQIDVLSQIPAQSQIVFIDLAVNNRNEQMTRDFIERIRSTNSSIVAIIDEHDAAAWGRMLTPGEHDMLIIKPVTRDDIIASSGALLMNALGTMITRSIIHLCKSANAADNRMLHQPQLAIDCDRAIKSAVADNSRRDYLARYYASSSLLVPDDKIQSWIDESIELDNNLDFILRSYAIPQPNNIVLVNTHQLRVNVTDLMFTLYKQYRIVIVIDDMTVAIGTNDRSLNLLNLLHAAGIEAGGIPQKCNISRADLDRVREIIVNF